MTKSRKITLGTKEWADSNVNCYKGCSNNCRYCYAKIMAIRFKRVTNDTWKEMEPNTKCIRKGYNRRNGRVMFPTSHDITEESLDNCLIVLKKLVEAGNEVLVTTKPKINCIKQICDNFGEFKDNIQFRFTITSNDDKKLKFWEPNAPTYNERLKSLKYAFNKNFKTSVSIEPFLDEDPVELIKKVLPYVTDSIWVGKMNYIKSKEITQEEVEYYKWVHKINSRKNLWVILEKLDGLDCNKIQIKDSITNYLEK